MTLSSCDSGWHYDVVTIIIIIISSAIIITSTSAFTCHSLDNHNLLHTAHSALP